MANDAKGKRKVYFTVGGRGLKPDLDVRNVSGGRFNKKVRKHKAVRNLQFVGQLGLDYIQLKSFREVMAK